MSPTASRPPTPAPYQIARGRERDQKRHRANHYCRERIGYSMLRPTPPRESLHVRVLLGWVTRRTAQGTAGMTTSQTTLKHTLRRRSRFPRQTTVAAARRRSRFPWQTVVTAAIRRLRPRLHPQARARPRIQRPVLQPPTCALPACPRPEQPLPTCALGSIKPPVGGAPNCTTISTVEIVVPTHRRLSNPCYTWERLLLAWARWESARWGR